MRKSSRTDVIALNLIWILGLVLSGLSPKDRGTWWMEVFPVLLAGPILLWTHSRLVLPRYVLFWICLHGIVVMIGGHYTYAEVPIGFWVRDWFGFARNHYDRLGHLFQGFVPALVFREALVKFSGVRKPCWVVFLTITFCMGLSMTYEFIEWWVALILGQGADAFLGSQGDPWDTQWDMFCATLGASLALLIYRGRGARSFS